MFQSPTLNPKIREDTWGSGKFLALRGERLHRGIDLVVCPGDVILSPVNGKVKRRAYPYSRDPQWEGVLIVSEFYWIKMFYFRPDPEIIGHPVRKGQIIGVAQDISLKYNSYKTPHVHLEVMIPPMEAITCRGELIGNEIFINPEPLCLNGP